MTGTIYNATDGPLIIDRAGRVLPVGERLPGVDLEASPVSGHIANGFAVVVEQDDDVAAAEVTTDPVEPQVEAAPAPTPRKPRGSTTPKEG